MGSASKPPYILLADRLPASITPFLLGRVVADPAYPLDGYAPEDPRKCIHRNPLEVIDLNVHVTIAANKDTTIQAKIYRLLGLKMQTGTNFSEEMRSKRVITRSLVQHPEAFKALSKAYEEELKELLRSKEAKGTGYMIVAIKSFVDAAREYEQGQNHETVFETEIPVDVIANAASHGATVPIVSGSANPGVKAERKFKADWLQSHVAKGEQVFAIRYRVVNLTGSKFPWFGEKGNKLEYGRMHRANDGHGLYSEEDGALEVDEDAEEIEEALTLQDYDESEAVLNSGTSYHFVE